MHIEPFRLERWQSLWEHRVEINLSDSGVHPLTLRELFEDPSDLDAVLEQRLIYTQTNGTEELRRAVAASYAGAGERNVQIVCGAAEANFIAIWSLVEPGDEVVVMQPTYMQIPGLLRSLGATVKPWWLEADHEQALWRVDLDALDALLTDGTRMLVLCNPNNPTGLRVDADTLEAIVRRAEARGIWTVSDEIYQGSELDDRLTPTAWARGERIVVTGSLSKSYGLPGLRLGWIVAPEDSCERFWSHHDYTTIAPSALSDLVATRVLEGPLRERLLERTRRLLRRNLELATAKLLPHGDVVRFIPPQAGAMLFMEVDLPVASTELAERLRDERSVLIVPGAHYGMDRWLRIGFGGEPEQVSTGLGRLMTLVGSMTEEEAKK
jgi:aspartate/methionine/tyrosine aminotransferase